MKTTASLALAALLVIMHAACIREIGGAEYLRLYDDDLSILDFDLQPGVRSLTTDLLEVVVAGEQVTPGKLIAKSYHEFIPLGLCSRLVIYAISTSGACSESSTRDREFDDRGRVTRELSADYVQAPGTDAISVVTGELLYTYDDKARTATCIEYAGGSLSRDDYTSVVKRVYPLRDDGRIYPGIRSEYAVTRSVISCRRVVIATDDHGNWTEAYSREETDDGLPALLYDYMKRDITYH
ncbi:MAG: hypothetical protein LBD64_07400 [Odoribacteraceae bacterium]|jgi:hypothetical protein|nr:hypothetical protein [Odoribacteraceae bacterium]